MRGWWLVSALVLALAAQHCLGFAPLRVGHRRRQPLQRVHAMAKVSELFKRRAYPAEAALPIPLDPASEVYVKVLHNITNGCMLVADYPSFKQHEFLRKKYAVPNLNMLDPSVRPADVMPVLFVMQHNNTGGTLAFSIHGDRVNTLGDVTNFYPGLARMPIYRGDTSYNPPSAYDKLPVEAFHPFPDAVHFEQTGVEGICNKMGISEANNKALAGHWDPELMRAFSRRMIMDSGQLIEEFERGYWQAFECGWEMLFADSRQGEIWGLLSRVFGFGSVEGIFQGEHYNNNHPLMRKVPGDVYGYHSVGAENPLHPGMLYHQTPHGGKPKEEWEEELMAGIDSEKLDDEYDPDPEESWVLMKAAVRSSNREEEQFKEAVKQDIGEEDSEQMTIAKSLIEDEMGIGRQYPQAHRRSKIGNGYDIADGLAGSDMRQFVWRLAAMRDRLRPWARGKRMRLRPEPIRERKKEEYVWIT